MDAITLHRISLANVDVLARGESHVDHSQDSVTTMENKIQSGAALLQRPLYSIQRCRKDDSRYGKIHFSHHGFETLCGLTADSDWWILTNRHDGDATCAKCIKTNVNVDASADKKTSTKPQDD